MSYLVQKEGWGECGGQEGRLGQCQSPSHHGREERRGHSRGWTESLGADWYCSHIVAVCVFCE